MESLKPFLNCLERYNVYELDTARVYCEGDTETVLGQALGSSLLDNKGPSSTPFEVSTKVYPLQPGDHGPEALTRHLYRSLEQLKRDKVKIFYLHAPDFYTPFEVTLKAVDEFYKEGLFEEVTA
jgi:aflatoxin B1 aldehyde reductase